MKILLYHEKLPKPQPDILERATQKAHMFRKTVWWDMLLCILTSAGGTCLFLFSPVLMKFPGFCVFVPVRNSVWEFLKLLYTPAIFTALLRYLFTGNLQKGILTTYAEGISLTMLLFLTVHYLFTGIYGTEQFPADAILFYFCTAFLTGYLRTHADRQKKSNLSGIFLLFLLTGCFIHFTFYSPNIGLFSEISLLPQ